MVQIALFPPLFTFCSFQVSSNPYTILFLSYMYCVNPKSLYWMLQKYLLLQPQVYWNDFTMMNYCFKVWSFVTYCIRVSLYLRYSEFWSLDFHHLLYLNFESLYSRYFKLKLGFPSPFISMIKRWMLFLNLLLSNVKLFTEQALKLKRREWWFIFGTLFRVKGVKWGGAARGKVVQTADPY